MASLRDFDVTRYVPQTVESSDFSSKVPRDTVALVVFIIHVLFFILTLKKGYHFPFSACPYLLQ